MNFAKIRIRKTEGDNILPPSVLNHWRIYFSSKSSKSLCNMVRQLLQRQSL